MHAIIRSIGAFFPLPFHGKCAARDLSSLSIVQKKEQEFYDGAKSFPSSQIYVDSFFVPSLVPSELGINTHTEKDVFSLTANTQKWPKTQDGGPTVGSSLFCASVYGQRWDFLRAADQEDPATGMEINSWLFYGAKKEGKQ